MADVTGDPAPAGGSARWGEFFGDLEAQFDSELQRETGSEIADRIRYEIGQRTVADRLRVSQTRKISVGVHGPGRLTGSLEDVGPDWLLLSDERGHVLVPTSAILWIEGVPAVGRPATGPSWAVPDLRRVLREWAGSRRTVTVDLLAGPALHGTFAGVFADHVDLVCHPPEVRPRPDAVTAIRSIPFSAFATIRRFR